MDLTDIVNPAVLGSGSARRHREIFRSARPFEHLVLDDFLCGPFALSLTDSFAEMGQGAWHVYDNPLEVKFAFDDVRLMPAPFQALFRCMQSGEFLSRVVRPITGYEDLESDPHMHGAGIHYYPPAGKLNMHLDYSIHPLTGKERRVNLIVYLNDCSSGDLVLSSTSNCHAAASVAATALGAVSRITPRFNRAVFFRTCDISWHGIPARTQTPRLSAAVYYVSDPREQVAAEHVRHKAMYCAGEEEGEGWGGEAIQAAPTATSATLCRIRSTRRLTRQDVLESGIEHTFLDPDFTRPLPL